MRNIKGPRSALTDFIEENKIRVSRVPKPKVVAEAPRVERPKRRPKTISYAKPIEIVNLETTEAQQQDSELEAMIVNLESLNADDDLLRRISMFLSTKRLMNKSYFDILVKSVTEDLAVFDCSRIKSQEFDIRKNLRSLELFQSGQIKSDTLSLILKPMTRLRVLRVTDAFLLTNFEIPPHIKVLDVSNCSRLGREFIENINHTLTSLDELRLSYCYKLPKDDLELRISVERLYICETKLSDRFIRQLKGLKHLSVKRCPNINQLPDLREIVYLDAEGIISLTSLPKLKDATHLNISYCVNIDSFALSKLRYLNVAHTELTPARLAEIYKCKDLEVLDVSWNNIIDDSAVRKLVERLNLKRLHVFGCFQLTTKSVELAYSIRSRCLIVGNPSETHYLLNG